MARKKKRECIAGCVFPKAGHDGPCALSCENCGGDGIVMGRLDKDGLPSFPSCRVCRGRGWIDQKKEKAEE